MALIKKVQKYGKDAEYWGKYNLAYDKATNKTRFIIYLFWDADFAQANPLVQLDSKSFEFDGQLTAAECYEAVKLTEDFSGAVDA